MTPTTIFHRNFTALKRLIPDLGLLQVGTARKSKSRGFMDLNLDVLERNETNPKDRQLRIALAHNYVQFGDLMKDPDMELAVYLDRAMVEALHFEQDGAGGLYEQVYPEPGKVNLGAKASQNAFLATWLRNLRAQHHSLAS